MLQATFLRGGLAGDVPDNPKLRAELEGLAPEALETRCRRNGVSRRGGAADQVIRHVAVSAADIQKASASKITYQTRCRRDGVSRRGDAADQSLIDAGARDQ